MKTLLTIGTSHVESGHDFLDIRNHMQADPVDARVYQPADLFFKTWPGYLQTQLKDTRVVNLGVSGHGLDYVIPRTYAAIDFFKPDTIILEFPSITRFTMANHDKPYKPQQHLIYSLSHIQTEDKYHHCEEIQKRRCLTAGVVGKQHRGFHKQWLDQIDEFSYINHLYKFKMLCSYIQSHDIELHTFSFNGDGFDIGEMHTDFHIDTHVTQEKLQSVFESNGVWEWSLDGSGHAGWNTERWMVANLFLPVLR